LLDFQKTLVGLTNEEKMDSSIKDEFEFMDINGDKAIEFEEFFLAWS
jgi:hypothetical protein